METIPIYLAMTGMILAKPVYINDCLLLAENTVLTERYIQKLRKIGIKKITVKKEKTLKKTDGQMRNNNMLYYK